MPCWGNLQPYIPQPYVDFLHVSSSVPGGGGYRVYWTKLSWAGGVSAGFLISFMVEELPVSRNTLGIRRQLSRVPGEEGALRISPGMIPHYQAEVLSRGLGRPPTPTPRSPEHFRRKAMAPHSNTLAWKLPWTEEPGGLQSMGSHRVRHD